MSHWHEACPAEDPFDPMYRAGQPPHPAEWCRCRFCGRWYCRRVGARAEYCHSDQCSGAAQRIEYREVMVPSEYSAYCRAAEAYFTRPEDPAGTPKPLKAGRGLSGFAARQADTLGWKRQTEEHDEREARERGW